MVAPVSRTCALVLLVLTHAYTATLHSLVRLLWAVASLLASLARAACAAAPPWPQRGEGRAAAAEAAAVVVVRASQASLLLELSPDLLVHVLVVGAASAKTLALLHRTCSHFLHPMEGSGLSIIDEAARQIVLTGPFSSRAKRECLSGLRQLVFLEKQLRDRPMIACGAYQNAFASAQWDGRLHTWGAGLLGQLGTGLAHDVDRPMHVHLDAFATPVQVAAGCAHTTCVTAQGELYSWGDSRYYQLGNASSATVREPTRVSLFVTSDNEPVPDIRITHTACGSAHTVAVDDAGRVYTFGLGTEGRLGHEIRVTDADFIVFTMGVGGSVTVPRQLRLSTRVVQASAGVAHTVLLSESGRVLTFGANQQGQLGVGDTISRVAPTDIGAPSLCARSVRSVTCGAQHTLCVCENGSVFAFGMGSQGRLGTGFQRNEVLPVAMATKGAAIVFAAAGTDASTVVTADGRVLLFGMLAHDSTPCLRPEKLAIPGEKIVQSAVGDSHVVVLTATGQVWAKGHNTRGQTGTVFSPAVPVLTRLDLA